MLIIYLFLCCVGCSPNIPTQTRIPYKLETFQQQRYIHMQANIDTLYIMCEQTTLYSRINNARRAKDHIALSRMQINYPKSNHRFDNNSSQPHVSIPQWPLSLIYVDPQIYN